MARLFGGERATLTVTSPPYNLGSTQGITGLPLAGPGSPWRSSKYREQADRRTPADYRALLISATENALAVSQVAIVVFQQLAGNRVAFLEYLHHFRHHLIDTAIWHKGAGLPAAARNVLNSRFEYVLLFSPQENPSRAVPTADFRGTVSNVYAGPPQRHNRYAHLHRATFPLHLPLWLLATFDAAGGPVYDPFLGTGTTLLAAERLGRRCFGLEIDPRYCDLVLARWERTTGKQAKGERASGTSK